MLARWLALSFLAWLPLFWSAAYGAPGPPIRVVRVATPPGVDGILNESVWATATTISDFLQKYPVEGGTPTERTEVYLLYTTRALYVGIRAYHTQSKSVVATTLRRDNMDQLMQDEQFAIAIDSYNDGRNGYWFSTNPLGVRVDGQFFDEGNRWEMDWDGLWYCQAQQLPDGWSAELEIPFSTLRFTEGPETTMGINLFRRIIQTNEQLFAPLIPLRYSNGTATVSLAQKFVFEGITGGLNVQVKPYILGGFRNDDLRTAARADGIADLGLDARYGVTDNLTTTLSVNTDFAQAEVDERQVNLTRFSLFFPEKRDFFLENSGSFIFGIPEEVDVFFSRRIGLARDAAGNLAAVPILAGGKVTGKLGPAEVGLLNVQTRKSGAFQAENFGVARVKVGVFPRSYVGGIFTNKWSQGDLDNRVLGVDLNLYLVGDVGVTGFAATAAGLGRHRSSASALHLALFKSGDRSSFNLGVTDIGSAFDPAMGFVLRPGTRKWNAQGSVPWYPQASPLRQIAPELKVTYYEGHDGRLQSSFHDARVKVEWQSEDRVTAFTTRTFEYLPFDFEIFRDVVVPAGRYTDYTGGVEVATKPGRPLSATLSFEGGQLFGGTLFEGQANFLWKVNRNLALSQFYSTSAVGLATRSFQAHILRSRVNYSLNTSFSIASLIQYDNASDQLGLNLRLNYIFREGTELFLVFNSILEAPTLRDPLHPGHPLSRALLLKLTYLLDR